MSGEPPVFLQPPFMMILVMIVMMYFLVIRPQKNAQKAREAMLSKVEKNDEVIVAGGIHATVVSVGEQTTTVRIADNVRIEVEKSAIQSVTKKSKSHDVVVSGK